MYEYLENTYYYIYKSIETCNERKVNFEEDKLRVLPVLPNYPFCRIFLYLSYTLRILYFRYFLLYILITFVHSLFLKFHNSVTTVIQQFFSSFFRIIFTRHFSTLPSQQYSLLYYLSI